MAAGPGFGPGGPGFGPGGPGFGPGGPGFGPGGPGFGPGGPGFGPGGPGFGPGGPGFGPGGPGFGPGGPGFGPGGPGFGPPTPTPDNGAYNPGNNGQPVQTTFATVFPLNNGQTTYTGQPGQAEMFRLPATVGFDGMADAVTVNGGSLSPVNQIAVDEMNNMVIKIAMGGTSDAGVATVAAGTTTITGGNPAGGTQKTINFSNVTQFLFSDGDVPSLGSGIVTVSAPDPNAGGGAPDKGGIAGAPDDAADVIVFPGGLEANETGFVVAGTSGAETFTVNQPRMLIFGKDGTDTFNVTGAGDSILIGGADDGGNAISYAGLDTTTGAFAAATTPAQGIKAFLWGPDGNTEPGEMMAQSNAVDGTNPVLSTMAWDIASFTGTNQDDMVAYNGGKYTAVDGGGGSDALNFGALAGLDGVTVTLGGSASIGGTEVITTVGNFEKVVGSMNDDSITGSSNGDILIGGGGTDTLAGGGGEDVFVIGGPMAGDDIFTDFKAGASGEKFTFDLSNFGMAGEALDIYQGTAGGMTALSHPNVVILTGAQYADSAAAAGAVATALTDAGPGAYTGAFVLFADNDASGFIQLFHTTNVTNTTGAIITDIGTITGTDGGDLTDAAAAQTAMGSFSDSANEDVTFQTAAPPA